MNKASIESAIRARTSGPVELPIEMIEPPKESLLTRVRNWFKSHPVSFFKKSHDGGKDSGVTGFWFIECKWLFSIVLLRFSPGTREAFHSHAFNAVTWWLKGRVTERFLNGSELHWRPSFKPKRTPRSCLHQIDADEVAWAISFRGPWLETWKEHKGNQETTLTHGRIVVAHVLSKSENGKTHLTKDGTAL